MRKRWRGGGRNEKVMKKMEEMIRRWRKMEEEMDKEGR